MNFYLLGYSLQNSKFEYQITIFKYLSFIDLPFIDLNNSLFNTNIHNMKTIVINTSNNIEFSNSSNCSIPRCKSK